MTQSQETLAAILREAGWTVIPPVDPNAAIPEPEVGQTWASPKPLVFPRTVAMIAPHRFYPSGDLCVYFTTPGGYASSLHPARWKAWARKSGARPQ